MTTWLMIVIVWKTGTFYVPFNDAEACLNAAQIAKENIHPSNGVIMCAPNMSHKNTLKPKKVTM